MHPSPTFGKVGRCCQIFDEFVTCSRGCDEKKSRLLEFLDFLEDNAHIVRFFISSLGWTPRRNLISPLKVLRRHGIVGMLPEYLESIWNA